MAYIPPVLPQLNGEPHAGDNCGPRTLQWLVRYAYGNLVRTGNTTEVRKRMVNPDGGTSIAQMDRAFESYDSDAREKSLDPVSLRITGSGGGVIRPYAEFREALRAGQAVGAFIGYAVVNRERWRAYSGDKAFKGTHILPYHGWRKKRDGTEWTTSYDPLYDGRRAGIPKGPVEVPLEMVALALAAVPRTDDGPLIGAGKAVFGSTTRATVVIPPEPPEPPTPPPPVPNEEYQRVLALLQLAEVSLIATESERNDAWTALSDLYTWGGELGWPTLMARASAGLPPTSPDAAGAVVTPGGVPPEE